MVFHFSVTAFGVVREVIHTIGVAVEVGHLVFNAHGRARSDIGLGEDLLFVAKHHHLINVRHHGAVKRGRRVDPADDSSLRIGIFSHHLQRIRSRHQGIVDVVGNEVEDSGLVLVEAARISVQGIDGKVVVVEAAPAPVEVELTVALTIAAAYESMASVGVAARVIERETLLKAFDEHLFPIVLGEEVALLTVGLFRVTEIIGDGTRDILRISARATGAILHVNSHATVVHQQGDCLIVAVVDIARHVVPLIIGALKIDRLRGIA